MLGFFDIGINISFDLFFYYGRSAFMVRVVLFSFLFLILLLEIVVC